MKKTIVFIFLHLAFGISAQIAPPSLNDAKSKITNNPDIVKQIEEKMGSKLSSLSIESDNWVGYENSTFSLTRTNCGNDKGYLWPDDAIYTKFIIQGKKNSEGVYKGMGVYVYYKRSSNEGGTCYLKNNWSYWDIKLEGPTEYGYKEFNQEEAQKIFIDYVTNNKPSLLNDFIEITKVDFENFGQSSESSAVHFLKFFFKGTRAILTDDGTSLLGTNSLERMSFRLKVEKVENDWKATNMSILDAFYSSEKRNYVDEISSMVEATGYFKTFKNGGWNSIYPTRTPAEKKQGELEQLNTTVKAFMDLLLEKKMELTEDDFTSFIAPSKQTEFKNWLNGNYFNAVKRYELISFTYKESIPVKITNEDGSFTKIAFPELDAKFIEKVKSGKKWKNSSSHCSSCSKKSTKSLTTTYHPMIWMFENGNWYLFNPESIFLENSIKIELN